MRRLHEASQGLGWLSKKEKFGLMVRAVSCSAGRQMFDPTNQSFISFEDVQKEERQKSTYHKVHALRQRMPRKYFVPFDAKQTRCTATFQCSKIQKCCSSPYKVRPAVVFVGNSEQRAGESWHLARTRELATTDKYTTAYKSTVFI